MLEEIKSKIRPVEDKDRGVIPTRSYSQLDLMNKCNMRFKLRYVDKNYSETTSLPLEIGSILHKGMELKGRAKKEGQSIPYDEIREKVLNGCEEITDKSKEYIPGINQLKKKYFEEWSTPDNASGMTYDKKMEIYFNNVLPTRMEEEEWEVIGVEEVFEFVYDERVILHGFIDRIDKLSLPFETDEPSSYRVVDYKSSKKIFEEDSIKTPLQMVVYGLACLFKYGVLPTEYEYDFILLDKRQNSDDGVCSRGYFKRGIKKLNKLLDQIDEMKESKIYAPHPSQLCHWCEFCETNPRAEIKTKFLCPYYSKWTPQNKIFTVNKEFNPNATPPVRRKLVF